MNNNTDTWNFQELILHRIHEILLVASPYDAFILEEDGQLTEQILHEYMGMKLSYAPRVWRASTAAAAMKMISRRKFDLIIVMIRISDMDPLSLGKRIKEKYSKIPVILLVLDESELKLLPHPIPKSKIDRVFTWSGNANVFPAVIKFVEDRLNVKRDVKKGNVRVIILVEDSPRYYSTIMPLIYKEITYHTRNLLSKSLDETHHQLHMRGRPKILLANTWEEAEKYYSEFQTNVLGIISDIRFPRKKKLVADCGIDFIRWVRKQDPSMPILLQSTDLTHSEKAKEVNAHFLHKESPTLLQELREFILKNFGFGNFEFQTPDGKIVAECTNIYELRETIKTAPAKALKFHAASNHFSNWLAARGEFQIATHLRPLSIADFENVTAMRIHLLEALEQTLKDQQAGRVIDFSPASFNPEATYTRISGGSLGGKARGLAFANSLIIESNFDEKFPDVTIRIPKIAVIGTNEFDSFMENNELWEFALNTNDNQKIEDKFIKARFSRSIIKTLKSYLSKVNYPIAVRSSSLLEDSQYQPFAGMYSTFMLANNAKKEKIRLSQLCEAIKKIYASTFFQDPKSIMETTSSRQEEEKMAILIQELVGQRYSNRFYPTFSGVAQSINYYPVSYMKRDEGILFVALGFGKTIVDGEKSLRFSPIYPDILPQYYSTKSTIRNSQNQFYALKMDSKNQFLKDGKSSNLKPYPLEQSEKDGVLKWMGGVISNEDNLLRDSLRYKGKRVITFNPILKWKSFPLADIVNEMLSLGKSALGCDVEIEFTVNLFENKKTTPEFCLLQIRPMLISGLHDRGGEKLFTKQEMIGKSSITLGDGRINNIKNLLYVNPDNFDPGKTPEIADEIAKFNKQLGKDSPYLLIGPGRWGSADPWLGIPVNWTQISNAKVIVEFDMDEFSVDPSFGSHFFQNVTSLRIGYFTVSQSNKKDFIDWKWIQNQIIKKETKYLNWVQLDEPIVVQIDGTSGDGVILKPIKPEEETMDEEESTGI